MIPVEVTFTNRRAPDPRPERLGDLDLGSIEPSRSVTDIEIIAIQDGHRFRFRATGALVSVSRSPASTADELVARIVDAARHLHNLKPPKEAP